MEENFRKISDILSCDKSLTSSIDSPTGVKHSLLILVLKPGFHMTVAVGDLLRNIGNGFPISRRHMEMITVTSIWKPGFKLTSALSMRPRTVLV